jgi:hypothetical protein
MLIEWKGVNNAKIKNGGWSWIMSRKANSKEILYNFPRIYMKVIGGKSLLVSPDLKKDLSIKKEKRMLSKN